MFFFCVGYPLQTAFESLLRIYWVGSLGMGWTWLGFLFVCENVTVMNVLEFTIVGLEWIFDGNFKKAFDGKFNYFEGFPIKDVPGSGKLRRLQEFRSKSCLKLWCTPSEASNWIILIEIGSQDTFLGLKKAKLSLGALFNKTYTKI